METNTTHAPGNSPAERQPRIDQLVAVWKEHKKQTEQEAVELFHTPEFQASLAKLREQNTTLKDVHSAV